MTDFAANFFQRIVLHSAVTGLLAVARGMTDETLGIGFVFLREQG